MDELPSNKRLIKHFIFIFTVIVLMTPTVLASTTKYTVPEPPKEPLPEAPQAPRTVDELIHDSSIKYGVSESVMRTVIKCESNFNPNAVGDGGHSFGLVQIHLPSHPEVTQGQATNPEFAVDFLANKLSTGQGRLWSCYKMNYTK
jgi:soluble lytic murein transglycosylase-like protein